MSSSSSPPPLILSFSDIATLSKHLDAADTLEVYLLQRPSAVYMGGGDVVSLTIHKVALGVRYRPPPLVIDAPKSMELTLEYGPLLLWNNSTSIPKLSDDVLSVNWDNEARIYVTQDIRHAGYTSATYLSSMTGAVLAHLLQTAVEYTQIKRRYQPFTVAVNSSTVIKSSSDVDFVITLLHHLAKVGVELKPLIMPPLYQVRLEATAVHKVAASPATTQFYERLYDCVHSIATGNFSAYDNNSTTTQATATLLPTMAPTASGSTRRYLQNGGNNATDTDSISTPSPTSISPTTIAARPSTSFPTRSPTTPSPTLTQHPTSAPQMALPLIPDTQQVAEDAAKAAQDAHQAATEAQQSGNSHAAQAAQAAATAAQKAADSTASQAATVAKQSLLSGDGNAMISALSVCLQNPIHNIGNGTVATAYVYWDASRYFEVTLTTPFARLVLVPNVLPISSSNNNNNASSVGVMKTVGADDVVDGILAMTMLALSLLGLLMLCQQVLGRNFGIIRPLYKFQRWFFDPLHHSWDDDPRDESDILSSSPLYRFGADGIPLTMGGRITVAPSFEVMRLAWEPNDDDDCGDDDDIYGDDDKEYGNWSPSKRTVEMELVTRSRVRSPPPPPDSTTRLDDSLRNRGISPLTSSPPARFLRHPDLVDLPDLTSTSKVAVPVSSSSGGGGIGGAVGIDG